MKNLGRSILGALPFVLFALVVLVIAWGISRLAAMLTRRALSKRTVAPLLREVIAKAVSAIVVIIGLYVVFRIAGLTAVALSVVGGTGLLGLILGIAFRDITENFLASIFLSLQPPFRTGDLLSIGDHVGYVERLTNRATVLMSLDGNHIQIPNSTVYRATIRNFTSSVTRRVDFTVGIGYEDAISQAQDVAMQVLDGAPRGARRSGALGARRVARSRHRQSAHLLLARWNRAQLAQGQVIGDPPRQARVPDGRASRCRTRRASWCSRKVFPSAWSSLMLTRPRLTTGQAHRWPRPTRPPPRPKADFVARPASYANRLARAERPREGKICLHARRRHRGSACVTT